MKMGDKKIMKKIILILGIVIGIAGLASAQDERDEDVKKDQMQTLFGYDSKITGYGQWDTKFTKLNGSDAVIIGGHGGVIFNSYLYFGLGAYGLVTTKQIVGAYPEESLDMHMGYTGMMIGFNIMPKKVVHFSIPIFVGGGNLELDHRNVYVENSAFMIFEPGVQLEVNLVQFMKIGIGGSYRMVNGTSLRNDLNDDDLSYWSGNFSIIFGKFK